ncbi:sorting nexin-29 [Anopheles bellator]|uniref:sorting nexin-29 n=1 Tax=Anopheles bellator TaxID=139047 RepID=UPI00264A0DDA|nr:sorting nexin-29 [Anopheles bellator]
MTNFTFSPLSIKSVLGINLGIIDEIVSGCAYSGIAVDQEEQWQNALVNELLSTVRDCQQHYGNKTELATEDDPRVLLLCDAWERILSHGLRTNSTMMQNVVELVTYNSDGGGEGAPLLWDFANRHLTNHEKERFNKLRHVWSRCGKGRALLRTILNERALERYVLIWLSDEKLLEQCYEPWALMRDVEVQSLLPNVATGLDSILFAIAIDVPELNIRSLYGHRVEQRCEPIIVTHPPAGPVRKINAVERKILENASPSQVVNIKLTGKNTIAEDVSTGDFTKNSDKETPIFVDSDDSHDDYGDDEALTLVNRFCLPDATSNAHVQLCCRSCTSKHSLCQTRSYGFQQVNPSIESEIPTCTADHQIAAATSTAICSTSSTDKIATRMLCDPDDTTEDEITGSLTSLAVARQHESERNEKLKRKFYELEERCLLLESRVAELSLENQRLRMLMQSNCLSVTFFNFAIPKAIQQVSEGRSRRPYHVYEIRITQSPHTSGTTVTVGYESWSIYRRYNEFYKLHKRLLKEYPTVKNLDFPPKKQIGYMNADFVEQRRQRLQVYLNSLFVSILPEVAACNTRTQLEQTFPFLCDAST